RFHRGRSHTCVGPATRAVAGPHHAFPRFPALKSVTLYRTYPLVPRISYSYGCCAETVRDRSGRRETRLLLPRRLSQDLRAARAWNGRRHRHLSAVQPGDSIQPLSGLPVARELSRVDRQMDRGGGPRAEPDRVALPERRREAERSVDGVR